MLCSATSVSARIVPARLRRGQTAETADHITIGLKIEGIFQSRHPELHSAGFADHVLVPRRIPDELHVGFVDAVDAQNFALRIVRNCRSHSAAGRGQSHFRFDARAAVLLFAQATIVDQTKIDDVNRNLGVITLPELVPDVFL